MSERRTGRELLDPTTGTDAETVNDILGDDTLPAHLRRIIIRDTHGDQAKMLVTK